MTLVKSMTGYGRCVETINAREYTVELRSVNNRYLDCTVKLPRTFSFAEDAVKQAVKASISRGKVDVYITVRSEGGSDTKVTLNASMVEGYLAAMKEMAEKYEIKDDISVSLLSRMNDVFTVEREEVDEEQLMTDLMTVVQKAITAYDAMRCTEGQALERDLRSRGDTIRELVAQVEAGNGQTVIDYRTRLENKLKEVLANTAIDESRILTEAAIFAFTSRSQSPLTDTTRSSAREARIALPNNNAPTTRPIIRQQPNPSLSTLILRSFFSSSITLLFYISTQM